MSVTAPDFTKAPPRSGRDLLGGYARLGRLAFEARALRAGTEADYIACYPISHGFLRAAGVSEHDFDRLIRSGSGDDELVQYFDAHVPPERKMAANHYVLKTVAWHLDEQGAGEGRR